MNFHRPSGFATITIDKKGKQKKIYNKYQTPYETLKKIPYAKIYLKPGVTFTKLDTFSMECSDNEYASVMDKEKTELFEKINSKNYG